MSYTMWLDSTQMPVTPGKLQIKIKGQNKTITLVNEGEVSFLKLPGLTEITTEVMLPMYEGFPFADYPGGFQNPQYYLDKLEKIITDKKPVYFKITRYSPDGKPLLSSDTDIKVSLESYTVSEDAANGPDIFVSLTLKQYKDFATKTVSITQPPAGSGAQPVMVEVSSRETDNAPGAKEYTVAAGDSLYAIAKRYYGDGAEYTKIFDANKNKISNPNILTAGQVITIP